MTTAPASRVVVPATHIGPPGMGHGGYVAGLLAAKISGAVQITLRKPTPVGVELDLLPGDGGWMLRAGEDLIADAVPAELTMDVPPAPSIDAARAAEAGSPSHREPRGVHPACLGCGLHRDDDLGLAITVGPVTVDGHDQVAAVWRPTEAHAGPDGTVDPQWVLAALDCPGAMAYIVDDVRAGLLGRIVFEQYAPAAVGVDHVVTGWQMGIDGRKMLAGTALVDGDGTVLAAAKATWFGFS